LPNFNAICEHLV